MLVENNCDEAITGMALGVDTVFALAVLELKREGYISSRCNCSDGCVKWKTLHKDWGEFMTLDETIAHEKEVAKETYVGAMLDYMDFTPRTLKEILDANEVQKRE